MATLVHRLGKTAYRRWPLFLAAWIVAMVGIGAFAVAVFFDAFVVRMALIPALMYLMGEKAWYLPGWLDRILPNVDVEGESLPRRREPTRELVDA